MIYLIAGASRAGKSILGRRVARHLGASYFTLDSLFLSLHKGFPQLGIKGNQPDDEKAARMWKFHKAMFDYLLYCNDMDYVIEGTTLLPRHLARFAKNRAEKVKVAVLGYNALTPAEKLSASKTFKNKHPNDWTAGLNERYQQSHYKTNIARSQAYAAQCKRLGLAYFDVSEDFEGAHNQAFAYLTGAKR